MKYCLSISSTCASCLPLYEIGCREQKPLCSVCLTSLVHVPVTVMAVCVVLCLPYRTIQQLTVDFDWRRGRTIMMLGFLFVLSLSVPCKCSQLQYIYARLPHKLYYLPKWWSLLVILLENFKSITYVPCSWIGCKETNKQKKPWDFSVLASVILQISFDASDLLKWLIGVYN